MKATAAWLLPRYETASLISALLLGSIAGSIAALASDGSVSSDFYGVAAQTLPVFLIALAVEQRLLNRLGMTEDRYIREAVAMRDLGVRAWWAHENGDPEFPELDQLWDALPKFHWVAPFVDEAAQDVPEEFRTHPPVEVAARTRFTAARRGQARWGAGAVSLLTIGLIGALAGLAADGSAVACGYFWMTAISLPAAFFLIAFTAVRDVVEDLALG